MTQKKLLKVKTGPPEHHRIDAMAKMDCCCELLVERAIIIDGTVESLAELDRLARQGDCQFAHCCRQATEQCGQWKPFRLLQLCTRPDKQAAVLKKSL